MKATYREMVCPHVESLPSNSLRGRSRLCGPHRLDQNTVLHPILVVGILAMVLPLHGCRCRSERLDLCVICRLHADLSLRYSQPFREHSQISGKQDTVCPASLLTPEIAKMVSDSIINGLCKRFVPASAESVVSLGNLPDLLKRGLVGTCISRSGGLRLRILILTMRVDRYCFTPTQAH
jgi:hypothetical protein